MPEIDAGNTFRWLPITAEQDFEVRHYIKRQNQRDAFHVGGSTHCLFFDQQVHLAFDLHDQVPDVNTNNIPVYVKIANAV